MGKALEVRDSSFQEQRAKVDGGGWKAGLSPLLLRLILNLCELHRVLQNQAETPAGLWGLSLA